MPSKGGFFTPSTVFPPLLPPTPLSSCPSALHLPLLVACAHAWWSELDRRSEGISKRAVSMCIVCEWWIECVVSLIGFHMCFSSPPFFLTHCVSTHIYQSSSQILLTFISSSHFILIYGKECVSFMWSQHICQQACDVDAKVWRLSSGWLSDVNPRWISMSN